MFSVKLYQQIEKLSPDIKSAMIELLAEVERTREETVRRSDFQELRQIVKDLAEAQKKTAEGLDSIIIKVEELVEAQKRTEERVEELVEAQKSTEKRVEELVEAQKRTEDSLRKLIEDHAETRRQLGGLSATVGYHLEDRAFKSLPSLLRDRYGIILDRKPVRRFLETRQGNYIEINIYAEGKRDGKEVCVIGESKAQLSKNDVDRFLRNKINRLKIKKEVFPIVVTYMIQDPSVEEYVKERGIALFYSYDFEL